MENGDLVPHGKGMIYSLKANFFYEGWFRKGENEGFRRNITNDLHHSIVTAYDGKLNGFGRFFFKSGAC
jgi:hypothetical protein